MIDVDCTPFGDTFLENGLFIQADISQSRELEDILTQTKVFTPTIDALVNNAALQIAKPLLETCVEEWDGIMASNLRSVFINTELAYSLLKYEEGAIVNVSSVHAIQTSTNFPAYAASKGGLLALTSAMSLEFAPDNILVNAILSGSVDTPMLRAGLKRGHLSGEDIQQRLENLAHKKDKGKWDNQKRSQKQSIS